MNMEPLLKYKDVAEILQCHPETVERAVRAKKLAHYKFGRLVRFNIEDVRAYQDSRRKKTCE